jgi:hypothetical protein
MVVFEFYSKLMVANMFDSFKIDGLMFFNFIQISRNFKIVIGKGE